MNLYRNLTAPYVDQETGLHCSATTDVHIYVNNGLSNRRSNEDEKAAIQNQVRRCARLQRRGRATPIAAQRTLHNRAIAHDFYGKAAPWEFRVYLSYALTFGRTTVDSPTNYCDSIAKLGIDCSGFVNAYLIATGRVAESRNITDYARNRARATFAEVRPLDLLIWQQSDASASRHIAIVENK